MFRGILAVLVGVLAIAVVGAGCGSSDDESLTKAEFVRQANAICEKGNKQRIKEYTAFLKGRGDEPKTLAEANKGVDEAGEELLAGFYEKRAEALAELPPPSGDEEEVAAIVDAFEQGADDAAQDPSAIAGGVPGIEKGVKLAAAYGLEVCRL